MVPTASEIEAGALHFRESKVRLNSSGKPICDYVRRTDVTEWANPINRSEDRF
jgi:hypothetical protein